MSCNDPQYSIYALSLEEKCWCLQVDHSIQYGEDAEVKIRDLEEYNDPYRGEDDNDGYGGDDVMWLMPGPLGG